MAWVRREPLFQFLGAGLVLFLLYLAIGPEEQSEPNRIHITAAQQRNIAALFERTWGRPPTPEEQKGLIAARIREEVLSREAIALGLSDGDAVVRKRLAQKLEFLSDDLAARLTPDTEDLESFLKEKPDRYRLGTRTTFRHVFIHPASDGTDHDQRVAEIRRALTSTADPDEIGDRTLLPVQLDDATNQQITATFGEGFAELVAKATLDEWHGPIRSSFGDHFVLVSKRVDARVPPLSEIREALERDWRDAERLKLRQAYYDDVRGRYRIDIDPIAADGD